MILRGLMPWLLTLSLLTPRAHLQMPMQLSQMSPMFAIPPPSSLALPPPPLTLPLPLHLGLPPSRLPVPFPPVPAMSFQMALPMPLPIEKQYPNNEQSIGVAAPFQLPFPIQVAIPAQPPPSFCNKRIRPYNCPVCPPCMCSPCMPAFFSFCSPCHQKCRCRDRNDVPEPLPHVAPLAVAGPAFPVAIPSPLIGPSQYVVPFHKKYKLRGESDENMDESSLESADFTRRCNKKREKRRHSNLRKFMSANSDRNNEDFVKPVLSYMTRDGSVKLEQTLSEDEAEDLLDDNKLNQRVYVTAGEDSEYRPRLKVISHTENKPDDPAVGTNHRRKRVYLKPGSLHQVLGEGKKEIVFNPPVDKKISNMSVSFQII